MFEVVLRKKDLPTGTSESIIGPVVLRIDGPFQVAPVAAVTLWMMRPYTPIEPRIAVSIATKSVGTVLRSNAAE